MDNGNRLDKGNTSHRHSIPQQPGHYRFRKHALLPWLMVDVFKESAERPNALRVRCAGLTFPVSAWFERGLWEGPLTR